MTEPIDAIKTIGMLTSGRGAPGMNAALRAVVRMGLMKGIRMIGFRDGYQGLIHGDLLEMESCTVSNIIHRGGSVLQSGVCDDFLAKDNRMKAIATLREHALDALIVIGGYGTMRGASALYSEYHLPTIGIPATVENDVCGTDFSVGFDTAIDTATKSIDKLREALEGHESIAVIEVAGRDAGGVALKVGLASGSGEVLIPEGGATFESIREALQNSRKKKVTRFIVVAEGYREGGAMQFAKKLREHGIESRILLLTDMQRGGTPTARDRILASRLGASAVEALFMSETNVVVGEVQGKTRLTPLREATESPKELNLRLLDLTRILAP